MSERDNGGPAFPLPDAQFNIAIDLLENAPEAAQELFGERAIGLTVRDYFAAKAMQGICARVSATGAEDEIAETAYRLAGAMLEARQE